MDDAGDGTPEAPPPRRPESAWRTHLTLGLGLVLCAVASWFELHRALGGNELSWAYVFEWPLLGAFAVYMWWRVLHPERRPRSSRPTAEAPEVARMREAWQEYQSTLHEAESGRRELPGES